MFDAIRRFPLPRLRRVNLWPRLAVGATVGFLALFVVLGLLVLRVVDDSRDRILQERLVIAQLAARQVDSILQRDVSALQGAAASLSGQDSIDSTDLIRIQRDSADAWLDLHLLNPSGALVASTAGAPAPPDPALTAGVRAGAGMQISAPYYDGASQRPAVALIVPVSRRQGGQMLLAGVIDLSRPALTVALSQAKGLGKTGHAELFDSLGRVIASTEQTGFLTPGEHRTFYVKSLGARAESVGTVPVETAGPEEAEQKGDQHIMAVGLLTVAPWGVAVGGSKAETLAPVTDLRNELLVLGAASLVVLWLATLVGARILVRPVRSLTAAADSITGGDLETPIGVAEGGEIGRLGETLEAMRVRLKQSLAEIEQRDRELEARVEERTKEVQRLLLELQAKEELRSRLLKNVITAQEEERKRIARELHDETGQALTGIIMSLEAAGNALDSEPATAGQRLETARALASQSIDAIRQLVVDLRPAALDDLGLLPALRAFADSRLTEKGVTWKMETVGLRNRLSPPVETCLFRVVQEAVTNIVRHSEAKSAYIELRRNNGVVSLTVEDDGKGFDLPAVMASPDQTRALGLAGMEERVALIGGQLTVSSAPGRGTRIHATIELEPEPQQ